MQVVVELQEFNTKEGKEEAHTMGQEVGVDTMVVEEVQILTMLRWVKEVGRAILEAASITVAPPPRDPQP